MPTIDTLSAPGDSARHRRPAVVPDLPRGGRLHRPLLWMVAAMCALVLFSAGGHH